MDISIYEKAFSELIYLPSARLSHDLIHYLTIHILKINLPSNFIEILDIEPNSASSIEWHDLICRMQIYVVVKNRSMNKKYDILKLIIFMILQPFI